MSKKNTVKLGLAAAVAASSLVAANPAQAAAASKAETLVKNAEAAVAKLKPFYTIMKAEQVMVSAEFTKAYNEATAAVKAAQAVKPTGTWATKLAAAEQNRIKAARIIDAVKVGADLEKKVAALDALVKANKLDDTTVAAYNAVSNAVLAVERSAGKVYGADARKAVQAKYVLPGKIAKEVVIFEVSRYNLHKELKQLIADNKLDEVPAKVALLQRLEERSVKIKEEGNKLHPGMYPALTEINAALAADKKNVVASYEAKLTPMVANVESINATQLKVTFNKSIDAKTLFADGVSGAFVTDAFKLVSLDGVPAGALSGELSADGKTLTVTAANVLGKRYDVTVDKAKSLDSKSLTKYEKMISVSADTTAPTIVGTEKLSATQVKVKFSEPVKAFAGTTFKLADGTDVTGQITGTIADGATEAVFTIGSSVAVNKDITATMIGVQDKAGNLLTPNPATVTFQKSDKDGTKPTVTTIEQVSGTKFAVKFSEELNTLPTVTVNGVATTVVKDSADATKYIVTASSVLDGAATVAVSNILDRSGEAGDSMSRVVTFTKDTVAPKVVSSAVVADATSKVEYLEMTFDKDVTLTAATVDATGTYVKDFITTTVAASDLSATTVTYKDANNKKVVRVNLDTLLGSKDVEGAVYNLDYVLSGVTSDANVAATNGKVTFTRGKDGVPANSDKVAVNSFDQSTTNNSKVEVVFSKEVDGATAVNAANYKVDGAVVESVQLEGVLANGTQKAVLTLQANSNNFTGDRNVSVEGVKAKGSSVAMDKYTAVKNFKENVAPVVTAARLTATDKITLTFSEKVMQTATTANDFEVLVGGQSRATANNVDSALTAAGATTVTIDIPAVTATELSKGLSLKALTTLDIMDANGNKLSVPANITVSN
ncbi:hypothetical protein [Metabacillus sp. FJAT-52054]|uniref:SbsC C-terminal domain-containing protein n=1 Tax=Metabacillus sediminis TaxID=3117746 RepID=A0ABZ2NFT8_9BACI